MIPKKIHYCWYGRGPLKPLYLRCIETWKQHLPDYEIILWNEDNTALDTPLLRECAEQRQWAFISDYMRLRVLHEHGGIYLDTDIEVVRSFDDLLQHRLFLGYEEAGRLNSSVVGAEPGHPYLAACMQLMDGRHAAGKPFLIAPEVTSRAYAALEDKSSVTDLPAEYFYPYNPYDKSRDIDVLMYRDITANTHAIHHWGKGWKMPLWSRVKRKIMSCLERN